MKRIVVTGATSMIGSALTEECLKHDVTVYAVVRKDSPKRSRLGKHDNLRLVEGELGHLEKIVSQIPEKCDTFYHIAWGNTGQNRNSSTELQCRNIEDTLEAVRTAHALGCRRFIGAGSQAEYGPKNLEKISPDTPAEPTTPYGAAKLSAGHLSRMLCRELGLEWIWPRIFSVYGIYEKESAMVASALRSMIAGEETAFTPAEQRWDYLFSRDAGRAYYLIGEKGRDQSVYCVGSGQARPLKSYIKEMAAITGALKPRIGARPYPAGAVMNLCADIESLSRDTGFVPEYSFEQGIRETVEWLQCKMQIQGEEQ